MRMAGFGMGGLAIECLMQAFRVKDEAEFGLDPLTGRRHFGVVRGFPRQRPCLETMLEALLNVRPDRIRQQSDQRFGIPAFEGSLCSRDDRTEVHPGELFPRVGFIVTNRSLPNERVLAFYHNRGTAEQHIKEGKHALKWTRLSCMKFTANAVRLQLHALACNLANFLRTLATPKEIETWSLTSLRERLI